MKYVYGMLFILMLLPATVFSDVPGQVNFQGVLVDSSNQVVDGSVNFGFALFDAATAGTQLWSENQPGITVDYGAYTVILGSVTPLTPDILSGSSVYLEVTVNGETLSPRQQLLAVPYALESANVAGVSGVFIQQLFEHVSYDGQSPPNNDPREGFVDTDNDGLANFIDPDNDNDGIDDDTEISSGSDINLVSPLISGLSSTGPTIRPGEPNLVTVTGSNFLAGFTVQVGPENPVPQNATTTSFDITIGVGQVEGDVPLVLTLPNTESDTTTVTFDFLPPTIATITGPWQSLVPPLPPAGEPNSITITGANFEPGFTVQVGPENPAPQNATSTSFDITAGTNQPGGNVAVTVTNPNGDEAVSSLTFHRPKAVFTSSGTQINALNQTAVTADAFCAQAATNAGLPGTFVAWYSDTGSDAKNRVGPGPWERVDGQFVALDLADLTDGSIAINLGVDEFGNTRTGNVATNTNAGGNYPASPALCLESGTSGIAGSASSSTSSWTGLPSSVSCSVALPYYCFEQ